MKNDKSTQSMSREEAVALLQKLQAECDQLRSYIDASMPYDDKVKLVAKIVFDVLQRESSVRRVGIHDVMSALRLMTHTAVGDSFDRDGVDF